MDKKTIKEKARFLRKKATEAENKLWQLLRNKRLHGFKFRRQYWIKPYIVDFICISKHLIIELDGSGHLEQIDYNQNRTDYLNQQGYTVIRFWNDDVFKQSQTVLETIYQHLIHPLPLAVERNLGITYGRIPPV